MSVIAEMIDPLEFRRACGRFATGVAIVTARLGEEKVGMTINSFSSVSLDPPLVLWSLRNKARSRAVFEAAGAFAVSILSAEQAFVARHFASGVAGIFDGTEIAYTERGLPLISGALAHLECETRHIHEGGDHRIMIGEVTGLNIMDGDPLLFFNGRFAGLPDL
ncbi:flavin reductase family protein [Kaistia dalseonensis]|uniref:Flavin reductase (DIM6/NTAB) family NADH-FMN oxidoreductase RutF n=1 Tax=Kaistia dalseonensis TaxID=410840 RepID=A0ABU0H5B1_9HYPH|nr:flavin reductase family protein [Kaistia dalseonensis]MCX5494363.1 flavin reductase family protein [Kaistia dalseonensis]MDQ0436945.1 flavin reductase (DIM6/NTAB) family NADH-FMN oxidoreductase RutF [Kaistia dalseonensis]